MTRWFTRPDATGFSPAECAIYIALMAACAAAMALAYGTMQ